MPWPQLDDFRWAIQNPQVCFVDPDLKTGQVVCDKFGQPKLASGNFACAYEIRNGNRRWAVRTFNREVTDQQRRYLLISEHLGAVGLPYIVSFQYLPKGILVQGAWYPIVKMAWVEGRTLTRWVWEHQKEPDVLRDLARAWRGMIGALYGLQMAHADLQQGNVLVAPSGELKLVDYDGMFVPVMHDEMAPELGHPNWNHPKRAPDTFGPYLDQFPGLVGYLSLLAVAAEPELLDRYCNDDNLILIHADFVNPNDSEALHDVRKLKDPTLPRLAEALITWCDREVDDCTLEGLASGGWSVPRAAAAPSKAAETAKPRKPVKPAPAPRSPAFAAGKKSRLMTKRRVMITAVAVVVAAASTLAWFFLSADQTRHSAGQAGSTSLQTQGRTAKQTAASTPSRRTDARNQVGTEPVSPQGTARPAAGGKGEPTDAELSGLPQRTERVRVRGQAGVSSTGPLVQSTNTFATTHYERSRQREQQGDLTGARTSLDQAIALDPKYSAAYTSRGVVRQQQGDLPGARADLDKAIALDPKGSDSYNGRGLVREQLGNLGDALADYDRAIALNPNEPTYYRNRGNLRRRQGDLMGARTDFDKAIALDPKYSTAYNSRGVLRRQQGDLAGARADYDRAIALNPNEPAYYRNRGNLRRQQGDPAGARADYDQAITLNPKDSAAYNSRGVLRKEQGDLAGAREDYDKAIDLNPNEASYYRNRGNLRREQGDLAGARADLDKALKLDQKEQ